MTMPEREVFATELNEQEWLVSYLREAMKMAEKLVPESRLLAAEARVREVEAEREKFREQISKLVDDINGFYPRNQAILEESRQLRDDLAALLPLARLGLNLLDDERANDPERLDVHAEASQWDIVDWHGKDTEGTTHARAILAREVGA